MANAFERVAGPGAGSARYDSLDIWRGLACLMVVVVHATFYVHHSPLFETARAENPVGGWLIIVASRMGIGVTLFFVISGYCIAGAADSCRRRGAGMGEYFARRFRRIFPPYWAALGIAAAAAALTAALGWPDLLCDANGRIPHPLDLSWQQWLGNLSLTESWRPHLSPDPGQFELGPAWTLCYEEQFYAVCGLLLFLVPGRFFAGVAAVTAGVLVLSALAFAGVIARVKGVFFDGFWLQFAVGVFVFYLLNYCPAGRRRAGVALLALAAVAAAALRYVVLTGGSWENRERAYELVVALSFGLLLVGLRRWDHRVAGSRLIRPVAFCGRMCYSLYLIHWPITKLVSHVLYDVGVTGIWPTLGLTIPLAVGLSVPAAWVFHVLVERRFLNPARAPARPRARAPVPVRPALAVAACTPG